MKTPLETLKPNLRAKRCGARRFKPSTKWWRSRGCSRTKLLPIIAKSDALRAKLKGEAV